MTSDRHDYGGLYLTIAAVIVLTVGALAIAGSATATPLDSPISLWIAAAAVPLVYILVTAWWTNQSSSVRRRPSVTTIVLLVLAFAIYGSALGWVLVIAHRFSVIPIAFAQTAIVAQVSKALAKPAGYVAFFVATSFAWALELPIMWLPLDDFLMSGTRIEAFAAVAFVLALFIITVDAFGTDLMDGSRIQSRVVRTWAAVGAGLLFMELGLRTDQLLVDWIPYHRSYFAGPAEFVRQGHWLLWDVPSQYGFLSILTVALFPGKTTWQSLYLMTAIFVGIQALLLFWILRFGRQGWLNMAASLLLCCAIFYGNQAVRAPFGAQLYPQEGLRFTWLIVLLCSIFGAYAYRSQPIVARRFICVAWASWIVAILWSLETGIWSTAAWLAYLCTQVIVRTWPAKRRRHEIWRALVRQVLPLIVLPAATVTGIALYYKNFLGRFPDWLSYVEFSAVYAGTKVGETPLTPQLFGTGLALVAVLTGIATFGAIAIRRGAFKALPLITGCAAAAWATSVYYVAEPFNQHVNGIVPVFAFVFGIYAIIARQERFAGISLDLSQAMIAPIYVMFAAQLIGEPARLFTMSAPLLPNYRIERATGFPPIQGELANLLRKAKITETDRVNLPVGPGGTKLSTNVNMPFVELRHGAVTEMSPWLPMTPVGARNALLTLPAARRQEYVDRFIAREHPVGGWLVTYGHVARCGDISLSLIDVRSVHSSTYSATLCALGAVVVSPQPIEEPL